ncbi:MAG: complex I NDUFA9 subunit family protein [Devosia sp.]
MDRTNTLVTIFGGAGFVGTQIVQLLARKGYRIRVAMRRPDLAQHVKPLGAVGQIVPIQANIRNAESVQRAVKGAQIVINLVGVGFERGRQRFRAVHTLGARNVAEAAKAAGAQQLVHMSALGADPQSRSAYARSKALGETEVLAAFPEAVIIRPSIIFGQGDGFFNFMGSLARFFPVLPLIGGKTKFQPVYVGDVAHAFAVAAEGGVKTGRIYELGGPEVLTHRTLLQRILHETMRHNPLLPLPAAIGKLLAAPFALLPFPPLLTADQVDLLQADNVVSPEAIEEKRTLAAFGVEPTPMDAILPSYLWRFRKHGQFDRQTA